MSFVYSRGIKPTTVTILQIPLDFISNLENSNSVPYAVVLGENINKCFLEERKLKILPSPSYKRGIITYGLLTLGETITTGSVISELEREGDFLTHNLHEDAVMVGTVYLH